LNRIEPKLLKQKMKIKMKLIFSAMFAAALMALPCADAATPDATMLAAGTNSKPADTMAALFGDPAIAKGSGFQIKQSDLDEVMIGIRSAAAARNETIPSEQMLGIEANMLNRTRRMARRRPKCKSAICLSTPVRRRRLTAN
jgi:hypothetical protein